MLTQTVSVHNILSYCTVFSLGFYFTIVFLQAGYTGFVLFRDMCELVMTSLVKAMRCQRNRNVSQYTVENIQSAEKLNLLIVMVADCIIRDHKTQIVIISVFSLGLL